jgi:hypothetical protein
MSIIVVEGCDGSGKSTLIERARENQKDRYFLKLQASRYPPNVKTALLYLNWIKRRPELDIILDRFHFLSDRVYGPILRKEDLFHEFPLHFGLQDVAVIVYCRPSRDKIIENVMKATHLVGVREHIEALIEGYDALMNIIEKEKLAKVLRFDYQEHDAVPFWRHVYSVAKETGK